MKQMIDLFARENISMETPEEIKFERKKIKIITLNFMRNCFYEVRFIINLSNFNNLPSINQTNIPEQLASIMLRHHQNFKRRR